MKKVLNTYFVEEVAKKQTNYFTGIVFELEDGGWIVNAQDGYIIANSKFENNKEFNQFIKDNS